MPGVVGAVVAALGSSFAVNVAVLLITTAISNSINDRARRKAERAAFEEALKRKATIRSSTSPRVTIYGEGDYGGVIGFAGNTTANNASGKKQRYLWLTYVIAGHECESIVLDRFGDRSLAELNAFSSPTAVRYQGGLNYNVTIDGNVYAGVTQATLPANINAGGLYNATMSGGVLSLTTVGGSNEMDITNADSTFDDGESGPQIIPARITRGTDLVKTWAHLGGAGQVAPQELIDAFPGTWESTDVGNGIAYMTVRLAQNLDAWPRGVEQIIFRVKGKKVYSPTTTLTNWTQNAARIPLDFIRDNMQVPDARVDFASWVIGESVSNELVTIDAQSTTQPRFTCNYSFTDDKKPFDIIDDLKTAVAGFVFPSAGLWKIKTGVASAPVLPYDETAIVSQINVTTSPGLNNLFNTLTGTYISKEHNYETRSFPPVSGAQWVIDDGREIIRHIEMPCADNEYEAQRNAWIVLRKARQKISFSASYSPESGFWQAEVGDVITQTIPEYGWSAKEFEVIDRSANPDGTISAIFQEYAAANYANDFNDLSAIDPATNTDLDSPFVVGIVDSLTLTSGSSVAFDSYGVGIPRLRLTWPAVSDAYLDGGRLQIQYRKLPALFWEDRPLVSVQALEAFIDGVTRGETYEARIRIVNGFGRVGDWTFSGQHTILGNDQALKDVTGLRIILNADKSFIHFTWDKVPFAENYTIQILESAAVIRSLIVETNEYIYTAEDLIQDGGPYRSVDFQVKGKDGVFESTNWASITWSNPQISAPTGISTSASFEVLTIKTARPIETDYANTLIYVSLTQGFTPSASNLAYRAPSWHGTVGRLTDGTKIAPGINYYIRIAHADTFGEDALNISSEILEATPVISMDAADVQNLADWGTKTDPLDQTWIESHFENDSIPTTRIASLVASKITTGVMSALLTISNIIRTGVSGWLMEMGPLLANGRVNVLRYYDTVGGEERMWFADDGSWFLGGDGVIDGTVQIGGVDAQALERRIPLFSDFFGDSQTSDSLWDMPSTAVDRIHLPPGVSAENNTQGLVSLRNQLPDTPASTQWIGKEFIAFDKRATYSVSFKAWRYFTGSGNGTIYAGVECFDAAKNSLGNVWAAVRGDTALDVDKIYVGYIYARGTPVHPANDRDNPTPLYSGTEFIKPVFWTNHPSQESGYQVDYYTLDKIESSESLSSGLQLASGYIRGPGQSIGLEFAEKSIWVNDPLFGNDGFQFQQNNGAHRFHVGDESGGGAFIKYENGSLTAKNIQTAISGKRIEINDAGNNQVDGYNSSGDLVFSLGDNGTGSDFAVMTIDSIAGQAGIKINSASREGIFCKTLGAYGAWLEASTTSAIRAQQHGSNSTDWSGSFVSSANGIEIVTPFGSSFSFIDVFGGSSGAPTHTPILDHSAFSRDKDTGDLYYYVNGTTGWVKLN